MMGESRMNPMSPAFTGELPDAILSGASKAVIVPNEAWVEANKDKLEAAKDAGMSESQIAGIGATMADSDRDVVVMAAVVYALPMRTIPRNQWPSVTVSLGNVAIPMLDLKRKVKEALMKEHPALAARVVLPEDSKIVGPS